MFFRHYQDVVNKYEEQVGRYNEKAQASMTVQKTLQTRLDNHIAELEVEQENFKRALEEYIARQIVKAFFGMIKAFIGNFFLIICSTKSNNSPYF